MSNRRYKLEPCEHAAYSNIRRADGTRVGGLSFHTQEGAPAVDEMNSLVDQIEEARAEAERLRAAMMPLAQMVEETEQRIDDIVHSGDECGPLDDLGISDVYREHADSILPFDKALVAVRDAVLGPVERCERCGSRLLGDFYELLAGDDKKWWRGCFECGPELGVDVTSEHEQVRGGGTDG